MNAINFCAIFEREGFQIRGDEVCGKVPRTIWFDMVQYGLGIQNGGTSYCYQKPVLIENIETVDYVNVIPSLCKV
jgi:hypothetical protein